MQSRARGSPAVRAATGRNGITPPTGTCAHVHRRSRMYHRLRSTAAIGAAIAALALAACSDNPTPTAPTVKPSARVGNGFPQGAADYRLNIIGVPKDKSVPLDNNSGARIFVQLYSSNTVTSPGGKNNQLAKGGNGDQNHIFLCNSTDGVNDVVDPRCDAWRAVNPVNAFGVVDPNATDGDGAILALPDPCPNDNLALTPCDPTYHIYA